MTNGGRNALHGFWYQLLYSVLRTSYLDIRNYSEATGAISAKLVFEGRYEKDIIVSSPTTTEYIELKSRRSSAAPWRLQELVRIFASLFKDYDSSPNSQYTFVTDGRLDCNSSTFREICTIIRGLREANEPVPAVLHVLRSNRARFRSRSALFTGMAQPFHFVHLLSRLPPLLGLPNDEAVLEALAKITITDHYTEDRIHGEIRKALSLYIPPERMDAAITGLLAEIMSAAKDPPRPIPREDLLLKAGLPIIPIITCTVKKACVRLTLRQASHSRDFVAQGAIRRPNLESEFERFLSQPKAPCFVLAGASGVGKTVACLRLAVTHSNVFPTIFVPAGRFRDADPLAELGRALSFELGRTDTLHIRSVLERLETNREPKMLFVIDGIDDLEPSRFAGISTTFFDELPQASIKIVFSCKSERLGRYMPALKVWPMYVAGSHAGSHDAGATQPSFVLSEYDIHEFRDALEYYHYLRCDLDDVGNHSLYFSNTHLRKPLYLAILSRIPLEIREGLPPSLAIGLVFETYLSNVISTVASGLVNIPPKMCERLVSQVLYAIASLSSTCGEASVTRLRAALTPEYGDLTGQLYQVLCDLGSLGVIYEPTAPASNRLQMSGLSEPSSVKFVHDDIGQWVLGFSTANALITRNATSIASDVASRPESMDAVLGLATVLRVDPSKYRDVISELVSRILDPGQLVTLMGFLPTITPDMLPGFTRALLERETRDYSALRKLSSAYYQRGLQSNAMSLYPAAIAAFNSTLGLLEACGMESGEYATAKSSILNNLAVSYAALGDVRKARGLYKEANLYEPNWSSCFNLAAIDFKRRRYRQAIAGYERALASQPDLRRGLVLQTRNEIAVSLFRLGAISEACVMWQEIAAQCAAHPGVMHEHFICYIYTNLGDGLFRLGQYADATTCFEHVVRHLDFRFRFEISRRALIYMMVSLSRNGRVREAESALEKYRYLIDSEVLNDTLKTYDILQERPFFDLR